MKLEILLRDIIKPELNKIYTEPLSQRGDGIDMGFFCREHAYHCYFLCKMLGYNATINTGELAFSFDDSRVYLTLNAGADHAWCQVQNIAPVDLSINFQYYEARPFNIDIVYGAGQRGVYSISYFANADEYKQWVDAETTSPRIGFLECSTVNTPDSELLDDPHRFLIEPPIDGLAAHFGNHFFSAITMHLFNMAKGKTKRLTTYRDSKSAMREIAKRYPQAIETVKQLISCGTGVT